MCYTYVIIRFFITPSHHKFQNTNIEKKKVSPRLYQLKIRILKDKNGEKYESYISVGSDTAMLIYNLNYYEKNEEK